MTMATLPSCDANGWGSALEGIDHEFLDLEIDVGRIGRKHRRTIAGRVADRFAPVPWTSRDDHRPERLHAPPCPLRVQPARRPRADHRARRHGRPAGHGFDGDHRPRRAVRRGRLLPGGPDEGHQADHRRRDLRRPPVDDRQGGQGRRPALPPDPPRPGPRRLPEPVPARDRRAHRRLLLQAAHRPRPPRPPQRGPHRAVVVPVGRDPQGARGRGLGARPQPRRRVRRHLRQGPLLPRAPGPRHARPAAAQRAAPAARARGRPAAGRHQRPPLRPRGPVRGARRPAVRRDRQQPRHAQPDALRHPRVLREVGGPDGGPLPRPSRGHREHAPDRRDDRPDACRSASCGSRTSRCRTATPSRRWLRAECQRGLERRYGTVTPELQARLDYELGVILHDGLRGLLPDRGRLHRVRPRAGHPDDLPRLGARARS